VLDFECKLGGIFVCEIALRSFFLWGSPMLDPATTALLRAVLDEVCESVSQTETGARTQWLRKSWKARPEARRLRTTLSRSAAKPSPKRRPCGADRPRRHG